jgi:hypothetical protein
MGLRMVAPEKPSCPSAQPEWKGSVTIGIVRGTVTQPRLQLFPEPFPVTEQLLALTKGVSPTEVFRFAAPCANSACAHFGSGRCHLVEKVVDAVLPVVSALPDCSIRPNCRWHAQEGEAACLRCPQVITDHPTASAVLHRVADPANTAVPRQAVSGGIPRVIDP